jgi:hypothetical protein
MNIERIASNALRKFPAVRSIVKTAYQYTGYAVTRAKFRSSEISLAPIRRITQGPNHHYFGYYDKSPWDAADKRILTLEVKSSSSPPKSGQIARIGYIDSETLETTFFAETKTWNFQQGCMLQWVAPEYSDSVIFNDFEDGHFVSRLMNIATGEQITFDKPIYCVSPSGNTALSLDFSRLHRLRPGYGYVNLPDSTANQAIPESQGITEIDLKTGGSKLLLSINDVVSVGEDQTFPEGSDHWVNHLEYNPSGTRFMFIHRWVDGSSRSSRLMIANADGSGLRTIANDKLVSHCAWKSDNEILSWSRVGSTGTNYHLFNVETGKVEIIAESVLNVDGHPSYSPSGKSIITDTYPDGGRYQNLYIANADGTNPQRIARLREPFEYKGEYRCDLHPRWNRSGTKISIDSTHSGTRQMYEIDVSELV